MKKLKPEESPGFIAWTPCHYCDEYFCNIHAMHAHDCDCPGIEDWIPLSPYEPIEEAS